MSDEPAVVTDDMKELQREHDQLMDALGLQRLDVRTDAPFGKLTLRERLRWSRWWIPTAAGVRIAVVAAVVIGALLYAGYGLGRQSPKKSAEPRLGLPAALPSPVGAIVLTAPQKASLRAPAFDGTSTVVVAPGGSFAFGKRFVTDLHRAKYEASLSGSAHFELGGEEKDIVIRSGAGIIFLAGPGRFDVTVANGVNVARTYDGTAYMKASGLWAPFTRIIHPGFEGRAERGKRVQVTRAAK
jgi:hypothetical protein